MLTIRRGFTLVEVMIVVVIVAILAGVILPQFTDSTKDAKTNGAKFNLKMLRSQIELYKLHHSGKLPTNLGDLALKSNAAGTIGTTSAFPYGPYMQTLPVNPLTGSAKVTTANANPPTAAGGADDAGWLYHPATGGVWIDDANLLTQ
ncbi:MAG: prepilin-type N-terminal cleavage/methylation domain-containing protein [Planctomycetia bacterium]|nr:prepilin-type N-terminal cleavage/methylation domain-containing protein [Planctomycetia bacterium]